MSRSNTSIGIYGIGSISALGFNHDQIWGSYLSGKSCLQLKELAGKKIALGALSEQSENELNKLINEHRAYRKLDRSVLMGIYAARQAMQQANWTQDSSVSIQFGSSRGATSNFEEYHAEYLKTGKVSPFCSPTTTLGNLASWVAQDLGTKNAVIENSVTCSTGLHAVINAVAWIKAGMAEKFIAGASEAPLTPFTVAQMQALNLYSEETEASFPCQPLAQNSKSNSLVLGEGACALCLASEAENEALAWIRSVGYAHEQLSSPTSISADGEAFYNSMKMAVSTLSAKDEVDLVLMHAPGTISGDNSELSAIIELFGESPPFLFSNKWALGHTFAASGLFSIEYALQVMGKNPLLDFPYTTRIKNRPRSVSTVLINSAGFGGNAASLILSREKL